MDLTALDRVTLDTSACIYFLDRPEDDPYRRVIAPVFEAGEASTIELVVSSITFTELLVQPLRGGDREAEAAVRLLVTELCRMVAPGPDIAANAARLRADHNLATPDALICATGIIEGADVVVGNDARWRRVSDIDYVHLDDLVDEVAAHTANGDGDR